MGQSYGERWAKEAFWSPATRGSKKTLIEPYLLWQRQSVSLHTWRHPGPRKPSSCATFTLNSHWGRAATGKTWLVSMRAGSLQWWPTLCDPVDCSLPGFSVRGFSRQEYWSILANTGCHTLLELSISCCPSCQLIWVPGAARTPATQAAAPPPHLALTGANPSPPGQPQELTPVDKPHAEVEIKPQLKPRDSGAEEDPNLPTSCESCNLDPHNPLSRSTSVSVESIKGRWELPQGKHTGSDSCGHWRQELTGVGPH